MTAILDWLTDMLSGSKWFWRALALTWFLFLGAATLNPTAWKFTMVQLTTASTTRDTTSPSNTVTLAQGDGSAKRKVTDIRFEPVEAIDVDTQVWLWFSDDGGTTKRKFAELMLNPSSVGQTKPAKPTYWSGIVELDGTNDLLYATITASKKVNVFTRRITY